MVIFINNSELEIINSFDIVLNYYYLHNYVIQLAQHLTYWQIFLLILPGLNFLNSNLQSLFLNYGAVSSELVQVAKKYPIVRSKDLMHPFLQKSLEEKFIDRKTFLKCSPFFILEQKKMFENAFVNPAPKFLLNKHYLEAYQLFNKNQDFYNNVLYKYKEYDPVLNQFLNGYFKDLENNNNETMGKILNEIFPDLCYEDNINQLRCNLEIHKLVKCGKSISMSNITHQRIYDLFFTDRNLQKQLMSFYENSNADIARLLYNSSLNIYVANDIINQEKLDIKTIDKGDYDCNITLENQKKLIIEIKSGAVNRSLNERFVRLFGIYSNNSVFLDEKIIKIGVIPVFEMSQESVLDVEYIQHQIGFGNFKPKIVKVDF